MEYQAQGLGMPALLAGFRGPGLERPRWNRLTAWALDNYVEFLGLQNAAAVIGMIVALILGMVAYSLWKTVEAGRG